MKNLIRKFKSARGMSTFFALLRRPPSPPVWPTLYALFRFGGAPKDAAHIGGVLSRGYIIYRKRRRMKFFPSPLLHLEAEIVYSMQRASLVFAMRLRFSVFCRGGRSCCWEVFERSQPCFHRKSLVAVFYFLKFNFMGSSFLKVGELIYFGWLDWNLIWLQY